MAKRARTKRRASTGPKGSGGPGRLRQSTQRLLRQVQELERRFPQARAIQPDVFAAIETAARTEAAQDAKHTTLPKKRRRSRRGLGYRAPGIGEFNARNAIATKDRVIRVLEAALAEIREIQKHQPNSHLPSADRLASILETKVPGVSHRSIRRYLAGAKYA